MSENEEWNIVVPSAQDIKWAPSKTREQVVEELVQKCLLETKLAHQDRYDADKAERTAACFLDARLELATFIGDVELRARQAKTEIDRIEAEKYFFYKKEKAGEKVTETLLAQFVAKDPEVVKAKSDAASYEADLKKWNYIMDSLKDGHLYFRSVSKNKEVQ